MRKGLRPQGLDHRPRGAVFSFRGLLDRSEDMLVPIEDARVRERAAKRKGKRAMEIKTCTCALHALRKLITISIILAKVFDVPMRPAKNRVIRIVFWVNKIPEILHRSNAIKNRC